MIEFASPIDVQHSVSLQNLHTLRSPCVADHLVAVHSVDELQHAMQWAREHQQCVFLLGQGSNIVLPAQLHGLVIRLAIMHITHEVVDEDCVLVTAGAGVMWDDLVALTLQHGWYGLENLSLIPGTVGAAPVQNIGAYGVELCSVVHSVIAVHLQTGELRVFANADCEFAYRDSFFKHAVGKQYCIVQVTFRLSSEAKPIIHYDMLERHFAGRSREARITPDEVRDKVIYFRRARLPDPAVLPNAGSFFKNPIISAAQHAQLLQQFPALVFYSYGEQFKLAAAWLIDQAGWKGFSEHGVGVHDQQALVLVNPGHKSSADILSLADRIRSAVLEKFGVTLEREPILMDAAAGIVVT